MSSTARQVPGWMTVEAFFDWANDAAPGRWQLVDGVPVGMAPANATHGAIQANVGYLLTRHLVDSGRRCQTVTEAAVVPRTRSATNLRVPDVAVSGTPIPPRQVPLPDPIVIVEILSPSNEATTRDNVWAYTTIPSVSHILVIHPDAIHAELLTREPNGDWPADPLELGATDRLLFDAIGFGCDMAALYRGTHLAP